jgi:hypothetical protein
VSHIQGRLAVLGLLLGLVACGDPSNILAPKSSENANVLSHSAVSCVAQFGASHSASSLECGNVGEAKTDMTKGTLKARLLIGGQNVYVVLAAGNYGYNTTTNVFSFDVTIQNLMSQPLGTTDGKTAAGQGTRIFVMTFPTVTGGTMGPVTLPADSGSAQFTAPNQPYWQYDGILRPDSTSAPSNWKFQVPAGAAGIQFAVEVAAPIPAESSVLRWEVLRQGLSDSSYNAVWQQSSSNIYAVGNGSTVARYNGSSWSLVKTGLASVPLMGVYGFSASNVWVAGGSMTANYNGSTWTSVSNPGGVYEDVWGTAANNVYAVGYYNGKGMIALNTGDGFKAVGNFQATVRGDTLRAIWGADPNDIVAVGDNGSIVGLYQVGNANIWQDMPNTCSTTADFYGVWGTSVTNTYAVGSNGTICSYNNNTGSWSKVSGLPSGLTATLTSIGGSSANDVWVTGTGGVMLHFNGSTWSLVTPVVGTNLFGVTSGSASSVAMVGSNGTLLNYSGSAFALSPQAGLPIYGVWATDTNNIYASSVGTILHYNGSTWTSAYAGATDTFNAIAGASNNEIFTVGSNGDASGFNGSIWSGVAMGSGSLNGVWVISPTLAYGCGNAGQLGSYNGTSYSTATPASASANLTAVWGDAANNVYTVATNGSIGHLTAGSTFTAMTSGTTTSLNAIHGLTGVDVWAAGNGGTVLQSMAGSVKWTAGSAATSANLHGVWDAGAGDVYVVGDAGTIQHYNGTEWLNMPSGVTTALRAVHGTAETHILVGGDNGVVLLGTR